MEHEEKKAALEYTKPEVKDYGDLRELTAAVSNNPTATDVPKGTTNPPFFSP